MSHGYMVIEKLYRVCRKCQVSHVCCHDPGDGSINFDEFRQMLQKYKPSKRSSTVKESVSSPASTSSCASEYDLRETFDIFDKDADGYLNAVDLRSVSDCFIDLFYRQFKSRFGQSLSKLAGNLYHTVF